jgi:hypothetical protein
MKKVILFLLVVAITAGALWGQSGNDNFAASNLRNVIEEVGFGSFFADETVSTEKRYSAGIFSSYADDFMWFTSWDADVGTFLLLGGYPASDTDVANTDPYLTPDKYKLNFGFAKSLKAGYLGVYYGGDLVTASGTNNGLSGDDSVVESESQWTNRLAVLYGKEGLGGIRLDILLDGSEYIDTSVNGKPVNSTVTSAPQIALGWGNALANGMEVYGQLGYKFADMTITSDPESKKKDTKWDTSTLALQAGIWIPLASSENSESSLSVDFLIGNIFGASGSGDLTLTDAKYSYNGVFLIGADASYKQVINLGKLSLGFQPGVTIGFIYDDSQSGTSGSTTYDGTKETGFELAAGVNIGFKFQATEKISLYTGLGLDILNFKAGGYSEGKDAKYDKDKGETTKVKSSAWQVSGFEWRQSTLSNSKLGFGLTFAPAENIVIGAGLNALLDRIIYFDFNKMQLGTGFNQSSDDGSELGWLSKNIFGDLQFDLTITVKF